MVRTVELLLLDISDDVENDDEQGTEFQRRLDEAFVSFAQAEDIAYTQRQKCCCEYLCCEGTPLATSGESIDQAKARLLRYIRVQDRYLHFSSLLLKSRTFHELYESHVLGMETPLVELPRAPRGKPYVPARGGRERSDEDFSVSHQFPYAGIARMKESSTSLLVGMDLVTFEGFNDKLYATEMDYVEVFRKSFTPNEWVAIRDATSSYIEFTLRWSIKEAYTKALGVGMGLEFNSFETEMEGVTELWDHVLSNKDDNVLVFGTVSRGKEESKRNWAFFFSKIETEEEGMKGCACTCIGPLPDSSAENVPLVSTDEDFEIQVDWTSIEGLVQWHNMWQTGPESSETV